MAHDSNLSGTDLSSFYIGGDSGVTFTVSGNDLVITLPNSDTVAVNSSTFGAGFAVLTATTDTPGAPNEGDQHIVPVGASGAWAGQDGKVATYLSAAWVFTDPVAGWRAWAVDEQQPYVYDTGNGWIHEPLDTTTVRDAVGAAADSNVFTDALLTKLTGIETGATGDLTAEEIMDLIAAQLTGGTQSGITVTYDDPGDGVNFVVASQTDNNYTTAEKNKLAGIASGAQVNPSDASIQDSAWSILNTATLSGLTASYNATLNTVTISIDSQTDNNFTTALLNKLNAIEASATADQTAGEILALLLTVDGPGSLLDADTLDGFESAAFARLAAASNTFTGNMTVQGNLDVNGTVTFDASTWAFNDNILTLNADEVGIPTADVGFEVERGTSANVQFIWQELNDRWYVDQPFHVASTLTATGDPTIGDGVGNRDYNDARYAQLSGATFTGPIATSSTVDGRDVSVDGTKLDGIETGATADQTAGEILTALLTVDGTGSLLDADLLDGIQAAAFAQLAGAAFTGPITTTSTIDGRDVAADGTKLDTIATGAQVNPTDNYIQDTAWGGTALTGTQTGITVAYNSTANTVSFVVASQTDNNFTTALLNKLNAIEAGATADQDAAEIRVLVDSAADSNVFTDADHSKLDGIESNATADQTASEIRALVNAATDSNVFTDADHSKLDGIESGATGDQTFAEMADALFLTGTLLIGTKSGISVSYDSINRELDFVVASQTDHNFTTAYRDKLVGIETGATADQTAAEIRTLVGAATDSNVFTDAYKTKVDGIEAGAEVNYTLEEMSDILFGPTGLLTNGTQTGITVSYVDASNRIDFVVDSQTDENFTTALLNKLNAIEAGATADQTPGEILTALLGVDGPGSLLDADTVDGKHAAEFAELAAASNTFANDVTVQGNVIIEGNATIQGILTTTTANEVNIGDAIILLNSDEVGAPSQDAGIEIERGTSANVSFLWKEGTDLWSFENQIAGNVADPTAGTHIGDRDYNDARYVLKAGDTMTGDLNIGTWLFDDDTITNNRLDILGSTAGNGFAIRGRNTGDTTNQTMIDGDPDGALQLYYNNALKFATTNTGVDVTGNIVVSGTVDGRDLQTDGTKLDGIAANANNYVLPGTVVHDNASSTFSANQTFADDIQLIFGSGSDLLVEYDSGNNWYSFHGNSAGAPYRFLTRNSGDSGDYVSLLVEPDSVYLYYQGSQRFRTTSGGGTLTGNLDVTGNITVGGTVDGRDLTADGTKLDGIEAGAEVNEAIASQAEAEAGTDNTKTMTPLRTKQLIDVEALSIGSGVFLPLAGGALTGAVTTSSTFDGRDVATDGAKLDTIATNADVTPADVVREGTAANITANWEFANDVATNWGTASVGELVYVSTDNSFNMRSWLNAEPIKFQIRNVGNTAWIDVMTVSATDVSILGNSVLTDARQVLTGTGLTGGGDLSADRTIDLDLFALTSANTVAGDYAVFLDADDSNNEKKATWSTIISDLSIWTAGNDGSGSGLDADTLDGVEGSGYVPASRTLTGGDGIATIGDLSANRTIQLDINSLGGVTATVGADEIVFSDADGGNAIRKRTWTNVISDLGLLTGVAVEKNDVAVGTRPILNFIEGSNITLTVTDDAGNGEVDITVASTGAAFDIDVLAAATSVGTDFIAFSDTDDTGAERKTTITNFIADNNLALVTGDTFTGAVAVEIDDASNSANTDVFTVRHTTSGTPAAGIGVGMLFEVETSAANNEIGAAIRALTTDVTGASEDFDLVFYTMAAGATATEAFRVASTGNATVAGTLTVTGATGTINGNNILTTADEGTGNGLDADTVDGIEGASLVQTSFTLTGGTGIGTLGDLSTNRTVNIDFTGLGVSTALTTADVIIASDAGASGTMQGRTLGNVISDLGILTTADEGPGNGIDADTVDGVEAAAFALLAGSTFTGAVGIDIDDASNNTFTDVLDLTHTTSGAPAVGIGVGMTFTVETTAGNEIGAAIRALATDVGSGTEDFDLVFYNMAGGATAAETFRIASDGSVVIAGNLTVSGTTTTVNSETLTIDDNIFVLNNNEAGTPTQDAGMEVERGTSTNVQVLWNETTDRWQAGVVGSLSNIILASDNPVFETRTLTGGSGVGTIGDLSTNRTINLDFAAETEDASPASNDWVLVEDNAVPGQFRKVQVTNLTGGTLSNINDDASGVLVGAANATTSSVVTLLTLQQDSTGTPAAGIGAGIDFEIETAAANLEIGGQLEVFATDVTGASEDFDFVVNLMAGGTAAAEKFRVASTGNATIAGTLTVSGATGTINGNNILTTADEGTGNGLDADTVDGIEASAFVQTTLTLTGGTGIGTLGDLSTNRTVNIDFTGLTTGTAVTGADVMILSDGAANGTMIGRSWTDLISDLGLAELSGATFTGNSGVSVEDAGTNTILYPWKLTRTSSAAPAVGIGVGMQFEVETAAGNNEIGVVLDAVTTDVGAAVEDFDLVVKLMTAGAAAAEVARFKSNGDLVVQGELQATVKQFDIPHPNKQGKRLRHGSLEGPENGVYIRGRIPADGIINFPDFWDGLVDYDSVTVHLTPYGKNMDLHVTYVDVHLKRVMVGCAGEQSPNGSYVIYAERIDVPKMDVEYIPKARS